MHRSSLPGLALTVLLALAGCDASSAPSAAPDGAALYGRQSCSMCHGPHGDGSALAPALRDMRDLWSASELAEYLIDPAAYAARDERLSAQSGKYPQMMPKYGMLDAAQRTALAEHVLGLGAP